MNHLAARWKIRLTVFAVFLIAYLIWVNLPTSNYQKEISAILQSRQQAFDQQQTLYGADPAQNTFLDPTFNELWRHKGEQTAVTETLKKFNEFNAVNAAGFSVKNLPKIVSFKNSDMASFQKIRAAFVQLLPKLETALSKPVFLSPSTTFNLQTPQLNFLGIRQLAQALIFEAALEANEKRLDEAARKLLLVIKLGHDEASGPKMLIDEMIGISAQAAAFETLAEIIGEHPLKPETLEKIIAELELHTMSSESLGTVMEYEILAAHSTFNAGLVRAYFDSKNEGGLQVKALVWLLNGSGLAAREVRLYDNDIYTVLQMAYGRDGDLSWVETLKQKGPFFADLSGRHGYLSSILVNDITRARHHLQLIRLKLAGLRLLAALQLYHLRNKAYPDKLSALPVNEVDEQPFSYQLKDGKPKLLLPVSEEIAKDIGLVSEHQPYRYTDGAIDFTP